MQTCTVRLQQLIKSLLIKKKHDEQNEHEADEDTLTSKHRFVIFHYSN